MYFILGFDEFEGHGSRIVVKPAESVSSTNERNRSGQKMKKFEEFRRLEPTEAALSTE
jgi:hypothetical protein